MNALIRFISAGLARFIERGSPFHAAMGTVLGIALAWTSAHALHKQEILEPWIELGIALSLMLALIGAIAGSMIPGKRSRSGDNDGTVNIWNLNSALAIPGLILIIGGIFGAAMVADRSKDPISPKFGWAVIIGAGLMAGIIACIPIFGLQLGRTIRVRSIFRGREYDPSQVREWGFEVSRGEYRPDPPSTHAPFRISFKDGFRMLIAVSPLKAQQIASVLMKVIRK